MMMKNVLLVTATSVVCLAILSIAFQYVAGPPKHRSNSTFYTAWPNTTEIFENEFGDSINIENDALGFRNSNGALEESDILFLGDSFIRSVNTDYDQTLTSAFNNNGYRVYNAGMDGFSTSQAESALRFVFEMRKFEKVILFFYLGNDFRDNYFVPPKNDSLSNRVSSYCKNIALCATTHRAYTNLRSALISAPKNESVADIFGLESPYYGLNLLRMYLGDERFIRNSSAVTKARLLEMSKFVTENNAEFIVVSIPPKSQITKSISDIDNIETDLAHSGLQIDRENLDVDFYGAEKAFRQLCNEMGIRCLHLSEMLDRNSFGDTDVHWNAHGQKQAYEYLKNFL